MIMHLTDDELVLHYYGEMERADERRAESHLSTCGACQQNYARLQRVMAVVDSAPAADAPPGFERTAWARLQPALPAPRSRWLFGFQPTFGRLAWVGSLVVVIAASFLAGRLVPSRSAVPGTAPAVTPASTNAEQVRERILLVDLGDHLDRSQMVLVELVSADTHGAVNISTEQARAQQLVAANRLYRQTAVSTGDTAMASLLDELERTLVDIAASPSTMTQDDLDQVRRRIESKGLLFKVRVVSSEVRDRQKAAIQERTGQRPLDTTKS
jgi:anti-sigma factor RsiW